MKINQFTKKISQLEGGEIETDIAQINEIVKVINDILTEQLGELNLYNLIKLLKQGIIYI